MTPKINMERFREYYSTFSKSTAYKPGQLLSDAQKAAAIDKMIKIVYECVSDDIILKALSTTTITLHAVDGMHEKYLRGLSHETIDHLKSKLQKWPDEWFTSQSISKSYLALTILMRKKPIPREILLFYTSCDRLFIILKKWRRIIKDKNL